MVNFLFKWQTLIGSFIGGLVGLLAALIVAYKERRRDENASARLIIADLMCFTEAIKTVTNEDASTHSDNMNLNIAFRLTRIRPILSPLYDASMVRVMAVDDKLDAHLH